MEIDADGLQLPSIARSGPTPGRHSLWHPYHKITARIVSGYFNLLLIFVPLGISAAVLQFPPVAVFFLNLLALAPLTAWISFSIGELAPWIGRLGDELLKATLGNPVEVLASLVALYQGETLIVQRIVIGNVLLYSLLVLGCCIVVVGVHCKTVEFARTSLSITSSLTIIVTISLIVPTIMSAFPPHNDDGTLILDENYNLHISHAVAIVLLAMCTAFFYFQFYTHPALFRASSIQQMILDYPDTTMGGSNDSGGRSFVGLKAWVMGVVLIVATAAQVVCVTFLIRTVDEAAAQIGISSAFLITVLLPLLGNASKVGTVVAVAQRGPIDLAVRAIIATNLRLLVLIMPGLVLIGWIFKQQLTLQFDLFDATMLFLTIMVMNYLIQDGRSNYFEGLVLMGTYVILTVAFEVRPMPPEAVHGL